MKNKITILLISVSLSIFGAENANANRGKALHTIVTVLTGTTAAGAFAGGNMAANLEQDAANVIQRIRSRGIDPWKGAVYSTYLSLDNNADSVLWADIFSKPDIYIVVSIEGQKNYLVPDIAMNYAGQPYLKNLYAETMRPGSKIVVSVFDDDTTSDHIWNQVLSTNVAFSLDSNISVSQPLAVSVTAGGALQLVGHPMQLDPPELIAYAEFTSPKNREEVWCADGILYDGYKQKVGRIQFAQIWKADPAEIDSAIQEQHSRESAKTFLYGLAIVLALVFGVLRGF